MGLTCVSTFAAQKSGYRLSASIFAVRNGRSLPIVIMF